MFGDSAGNAAKLIISVFPQYQVGWYNCGSGQDWERGAEAKSHRWSE